jgi:hypothetical protein
MIPEHFRISSSGGSPRIPATATWETLAHKKRPRRVLVVNQSTLIRRLRRIRSLLKGLEVLVEDQDR